MTFDEFAAARLPALLRYAMVLSGDRELARDLVQEALIKALVRWHRVERADEPYAYVRAIVTNLYLSLLRRRRFRTVPLGDLDTAAALTVTDRGGRATSGTVGPPQGSELRRPRFHEAGASDSLAGLRFERSSDAGGAAHRDLLSMRSFGQPQAYERHCPTEQGRAAGAEPGGSGGRWVRRFAAVAPWRWLIALSGCDDTGWCDRAGQGPRRTTSTRPRRCLPRMGCA